jgi:transaldolase/glucose-6-phosphate isomerase
VTGLEKGARISTASVASFFLSRIDTAVDEALAGRALTPTEDPRGKVAIACAKLAYQRFKVRLESAAWNRLASRGARPQRLLWASTSTKNPSYPDTLYVQSLIGPLTINTMPRATLEAFRDHGRAALTLDRDVADAESVLRQLERAGVSLRALTDGLLEQGLKRFSQDFDALIESLRQKVAELRASPARAQATT